MPARWGRFGLEVSTLGSPAEVELQRVAETVRTAPGPGSPPKGRLLIAETGWLQTPPSCPSSLLVRDWI